MPRRERWLLVELAREAVRNCSSRGGKVRGSVAIALLGALTVVGIGLGESQELWDRVAAAEAAGGGVVQVRSADAGRPASIERSSCEALAGDDRVERAGILDRPHLADVPQIGARQRVITSSPALFPELARADVVLGAELPDISGALVWQGQAVTVERLTTQPSGLDVNLSLVVAATPDLSAVDSCMVVLAPWVTPEAVASDILAQIEVEGGPVIALSQNDLADVIGQYLGRFQRPVALLVGVVGGLSAGMIALFRARELAVYRLSGTSARDLALLLALEQGVVAGAFAASGTVAAWALSDGLVSASATALWVVAGALTWWLTACLAMLPVVARNPISRRPG